MKIHKNDLKNMKKVLYGYRPACVNNTTGIPGFVKKTYSFLKIDKAIYINTTGCFLELIPKKLYRVLYFIPLFYYKLFLPLRLLLGRYDYYIENNYFFIPLWKPKDVKVITIIYDIGFVLFDNIQTETVIRRWRKKLVKSIKNTDIIITISQSSKQDIEKYLQSIGMGDKPVYCMYCDAQLELPNMDTSKETLEKYRIGNEYFLFLGTLEPRKNPLNMIKAFHHFKEKYETNIKFVFSGGKGWLYDDVLAYVEKYDLHNEVIFTGYVSEDEKYFLLKGASAFIFLSIYEGFGIPPLEALKVDTPVLLSDISVFHELFEDSVWYANGNDIEDISNKMNKIMMATEPKDTFRIIEKFSWEKSANILIDIINKEAIK